MNKLLSLSILAISLLSLSILAISFIPLASGDADAAKRRPQYVDFACTCACFRDSQGTVRLRSTVKTTIRVDVTTNASTDCSQLDGGGCRYLGVTPGTLSGCTSD